MSNDQLGELLNAVAWQHRAEGYGLLAKPQGSNCLQPQTGTRVSRDILMLAGSGRIFDVLIDAEGKATPTWGEKNALSPKLFVTPIDSTVPLPQPLTDPLTQPLIPPPTTQPYPDEATWWTALFEEIDRLYGLANHTARPRDVQVVRPYGLRHRRRDGQGKGEGQASRRTARGPRPGKLDLTVARWKAGFAWRIGDQPADEPTDARGSGPATLQRFQIRQQRSDS
jgi:hypothetical protein